VVVTFASIFRMTTTVDDDADARYQCCLTGKIIHLPVRLMKNHDSDGFPVYSQCVREKGAFAGNGGRPCVQGFVHEGSESIPCTGVWQSATQNSRYDGSQRGRAGEGPWF
jgi:hypothetical protein